MTDGQQDSQNASQSNASRAEHSDLVKPTDRSGSPNIVVTRKMRKRRSDLPFFLIMGGLSSCFVLLVVLLLAADVVFTSPEEFVKALQKPEIQYATKLTFITCTVSAIMSVWVATPLGYILSRFQFPGRSLIDTLVDIPIVLPPLVLGLSLLILFHLEFGGDEADMPAPPKIAAKSDSSGDRKSNAESVREDSEFAAGKDKNEHSTAAATVPEPVKDTSTTGWQLERWLKKDVGFPVTYRWPAVILAQFSVACAFAVRTMRVTFDQMNPRAEDVARTLGCTRQQAFGRIALPQAWRGIIAAGTIAWARALGEFGPILVFAGATRMRTEVLSTTVFLELSIGNLDAAVAVSLLMVMMAVLVLCFLRLLGTGLNT